MIVGAVMSLAVAESLLDSAERLPASSMAMTTYQYSVPSVVVVSVYARLTPVGATEVAILLPFSTLKV